MISKKIKIWWILLSLLSLWGITVAWSYPLQEIHKGEFNEVPHIENADYYKYKNQEEYRTIYTTLRTSTYYNGRDIGAWSHEWVDFATDKGTLVYASHDWIVTYAWYNGNRWNVIIIKHQWNQKTYYTIYAHLNAIFVKKGQEIKEKEVIWEVGDTWNATGPHLHFQIDTNENSIHPFYPNCQWTIDETVNNGNCINAIKQNTIDPIYFLEVTTKKQDSPSTPLFIGENTLILSWFQWGFMELWDIKQLHIIKTWENQGTFLSNDIIIKNQGTEITITPNIIKAMGNQRQILFQNANTTGFSIISINYGEKKLIEFPIIINTHDQIETRKNNKQICQLLEELFNIKC